MIGIIITGHGRFASGINSAAKTLTGYDTNVKVVDYLTEEMSVEEFESQLVEAYQELSKCDKVIVLCDILGGTPFKSAITNFLSDNRVRFMYGTNVGMTIKLFMDGMMDSKADVDTICDQLVGEAVQHVGKFVLETVEEESNEDGI